MSRNDLFFNDNVASINKSINLVLAATCLVPVAFIVFTMINLWIVPYDYAISVLVYTILVSIIHFFLNRNTESQKMLSISKYFGVLAIIGFVDLLGYKNVINITISFAFAPFFSCLYYDRRFTNIISVLDYISVIAVTYIRSLTVLNTIQYVEIEYTPFVWFISWSIGITIEFVFVFILCDRMNDRTHKTLQRLIETDGKRSEALVQLKNKNEDLHDTQFKIIEFVSKCLGSHDLFTGQHVIHTKRYVEIISKQLRDEGHFVEELTDETIELFSTSAFLHDIGKIHIPEGVLNKPGKFTADEFALMKSHPEEGKKLLEYLPKIDDGRFNEIALEMAYCHHEKWDGTGYPRGLRGEDIPLCARIMAAADVLDALTSKRLYKDPMTVDEAIDVFEKSKGSHFEPCIAEAVIHCKKLIELIDNDFKTAEAVSQSEELQWWLRYHQGLSEKN